MAKNDIKKKTMLEKIAGKTVRDVVPYECDEYSDLGNAELVTFIDGTQNISCELYGECSHKCGFPRL